MWECVRWNSFRKQKALSNQDNWERFMDKGFHYNHVGRVSKDQEGAETFNPAGWREGMASRTWKKNKSESSRSVQKAPEAKVTSQGENQGHKYPDLILLLFFGLLGLLFNNPSWKSVEMETSWWSPYMSMLLSMGRELDNECREQMWKGKQKIYGMEKKEKEGYWLTRMENTGIESYSHPFPHYS